MGFQAPAWGCGDGPGSPKLAGYASHMINMECDMAKNVMMIVRMVMVSRVMMDGNGNGDGWSYVTPQFLRSFKVSRARFPESRHL